MRHTRLVFGVVAALLLAGCGSSHHDAAPTTAPPVATTPAPTTAAPTTVAPTTTPPTTVAPTTTTTVPNPDGVPAVITPAYVNAVFKVLDHVLGNSLRLDLATTNVPPAALADLRAVFNDPLYAEEKKIAIEEFTTDLTNVRMPPGDDINTVVRLISTSPVCIFVQTTLNVSKVVYKLPPPGFDYYELQLKQAGDDPGNLNPTPWALTYELYFRGTPPSVQDRCDTGT
jgi:uncharacterized lipoprotein